MPAVLSLENPVFRTYAFFSSILVLKSVSTSLLQDLKGETLRNIEDAQKFKAELRVDESVDRIHRSHLKDLENNTPFFVTGFIYTLTDPPQITAKILFLAYTIARFCHSFSYGILPLPQPCRTISYFAGYFINGYMAISEASSSQRYLLEDLAELRVTAAEQISEIHGIMSRKLIDTLKDIDVHMQDDNISHEVCAVGDLHYNAGTNPIEMEMKIWEQIQLLQILKEKKNCPISKIIDAI